MFPVDLPALSDTDLTSASALYLSSLRSRPDEWFPLSHSEKVELRADNMRRLQLFEDDQADCSLLALHLPDEPSQVVALFLHGKWWSVDDVLRTSSVSRSGLVQVQSMVERVIVFLLSQVVERSQDEALFSLHPRTESCKLLWTDGQAVGFYSIKPKGSLCGGGCGARCYLLPALDTVLVRRSWRRRGFALHMLKDFCSSFSSERFLGLSSPLSPSMAAVCRRFLQQHEEHLEHLYEVEAPGDWTQRRNIWLGIQLGRYSLDVNEETQRRDGDDSAHKMNPRDRSSPSSPTGGTGCCSSAHTADLHPEASPNTTQALKHERSASPEETQRHAKRARRT